jgi:hypothetical protein
MSIERELLKVAVIALEDAHFNSERDQAVHLRASVIKQLKDLLAQGEQEPVGIVKTIGGYPDNSTHTVELTGRHGDLRDGDLLYKAPQKREPLSESRIAAIWNDSDKTDVAITRAIEKLHGITGGGE